ncbi:MAG: hypothetical protein ACRDMV_11905, partial [Streptosporangiales bacterium]
MALPLAVRLRPEAMRGPSGANLSVDTFLGWAAYEADRAEADGTVVIVAADQAAREMGMSRSTVCRARAAARRLGVYRTLLEGRPGTLGDRGD